MEEESGKPPQLESVQDKIGTMQKCTLNKVIGYGVGIIVAFGFTIGLMCVGMLTCHETSELDKLIDCEEDGLLKFKSGFENSQKDKTLSPRTSELDELVDCKQKDSEGSASLGIIFYIRLVCVFIFTIGNLFLSQEPLATSTPPKPVNYRTLTLIRICMTSGLLLIAVDFFGKMLGYLDTEIYTLVILHVGLLVLFKGEGDDKGDEEPLIMEEEAKELEHPTADKN